MLVTNRTARCPALARDVRTSRAVRQRWRLAATVRQAGPADPPPDYSALDNQPMNRAIMQLFQKKMELAVEETSDELGYDAIPALTKRMHQKERDPVVLREKTLFVLRSMFPDWLAPAFRVLFAKPLPALSNKMNALVTAWTCQWLMGPSKVIDVELDNGQDGKWQGVKVERCRYLESTGCVSVCINSCKLPTQQFFREDMGLDVTMEPDYDDFSCTFTFGKVPLPPEQDEALRSPCFAQCPTKRRALEELEANCHRVGELPNAA